VSLFGDDEATEGSDGAGNGRTVGWWWKVGIAAAVAPLVSFFVLTVVLLSVGGFDPGSTFGVSDAFLNGVLVVGAGLLGGVVVGLVAGIRGWTVTVPALTGALVGLTIFLGLLAVADETPVWLVFVGQSAAIFAATSLTGFSVAAAAGAVTLVGIGLGFVLQPASEPPAELFLVLTEEYQVDDANGACSGSGDFSGVAEGSKASVIGTQEVEELEPIVLPSGSEITLSADTEYLLWNGADTGCLFVLGSQELGASEYSGTFLFPESLGSGAEGETSGERVVFLFGEF